MRNWEQEALLANLFRGDSDADIFGLVKVHAEEDTFPSAEDEAEYYEAMDLDPREQADRNLIDAGTATIWNSFKEQQRRAQEFMAAKLDDDDQ